MSEETKKLSVSVWAISAVSMLVNISASMMFSAMPTYLTNVIKIDPRALGHLEGGLEFIAYVLRLVSGIISDYFRKRKVLLAIAIFMIACSRPLMAFFPVLIMIVLARVLDRLGNGLQATPREALVSDHTPKALKGAAYGLRNSMGMLGSFLGAVILWGIMYLSHVDYSLIFGLAIIPPVVGLVVLVIFVKDKLPDPSDGTKGHEEQKRFHWRAIHDLRWDYWKVILIGALFCLANPAGTFLILHATSKGLPECDTPTVMMLQNAMASLISYPIGHLSDKISRFSMLVLCSVLMVAANYFMFVAEDLVYVYIGITLWGLQFGLNQSLLFAEIASHVPKGIRGTGFAIFYMVAAVCLYITNAAAGYIKACCGTNYIYAFCGTFALLGLCAIYLTRAKPSEPREQHATH